VAVGRQCRRARDHRFEDRDLNMVGMHGKMFELVVREKTRVMCGGGLGGLAPEQGLENGLREMSDKGGAISAEILERTIHVVAVVHCCQFCT